MPIWLSFLVCMAAHSTACYITVPTNRPFVGIAACQLEGMEGVPSWEEMHPGWKVSRIRCSIGNKPKAEDTT